MVNYDLTISFARLLHVYILSFDHITAFEIYLNNKEIQRNIIKIRCCMLNLYSYDARSKSMFRTLNTC